MDDKLTLLKAGTFVVKVDANQPSQQWDNATLYQIKQVHSQSCQVQEYDPEFLTNNRENKIAGSPIPEVKYENCSLKQLCLIQPIQQYDINKSVYALWADQQQRVNNPNIQPQNLELTTVYYRSKIDNVDIANQYLSVVFEDSDGIPMVLPFTSQFDNFKLPVVVSLTPVTQDIVNNTIEFNKISHLVVPENFYIPLPDYYEQFRRELLEQQELGITSDTQTAAEASPYVVM